MKRTRISRTQSWLPIQIQLQRSNDGGMISAGRATSFLWEHEGNWHLITNLHNFTGWDHVKKQALSATGIQPTHVEFRLAAISEMEGTSAEEDNIRMVWRSFTIPLYEDDNPLWLVHPNHGDNVDVASLIICETPTFEECEKQGVVRFQTTPVNKHEFDKFEVWAGFDAFVLGFPHGMNANGFPIWKRASVASEPDIDLDGLPKFLIDTATRKGMSGSPVVCVNRGLTNPSGEFGEDSIIGEAVSFLGIYSGRIGDDELGVQLGVVWKAAVIDEILDGKIQGKVPWD